MTSQNSVGQPGLGRFEDLGAARAVAAKRRQSRAKIFWREGMVAVLMVGRMGWVEGKNIERGLEINRTEEKGSEG